MCTRYVFTDPAEAIREWFETTGSLPNWPPNYNVAPTHVMPIIRSIDGGSCQAKKKPPGGAAE